MRPNGVCVLAVCALVSPALMTGAAAQVRRGGGGGGGGGAPAPHMAAPAAAPHMAAPAPHFAAPAAAPHIAAPAPHFSAPAAHFAAPRAAPHFAASPHISAPHVNAERFARPHVNAEHMARPHVERSHVASPHVNTPGVTRRNAEIKPAEGNRANRNALAPSTNRAGSTVGNAADRLRGRNAPSTVGQGPGGNAAAAFNARQGTRGNNILRNAALSNASARDPAARGLSSSTFRGGFAQSSFARNFDRDRHHRHGFGFVLGFVGPVFWPYAYDDFIDYTFWPSAYDTFWPYAYDDVFEGLYGGYAPEYGAAYAYAGAPASSRAYERGGAGGRGGQGSAATQICSGDARGLTDFPIDQISRQVQPTQEQQGLLNDLKASTDKAVQILQAACPNDLPATPTGRLAAMRIRVQAMLQAVQTVRPALDKFYDSLNDEQKERFNALDQGNASTAQDQSAEQLCGGRRKGSVVNFPVDRIQQSLRLSDAQDANLRAVSDASAKAADILNAACPNGQAQQLLTPPGRINGMEQRLDAMLQAIDTVRPALTKFYASLSDEQKARFDRMGRRPT